MRLGEISIEAKVKESKGLVEVSVVWENGMQIEWREAVCELQRREEGKHKQPFQYFGEELFGDFHREDRKD